MLVKVWNDNVHPYSEKFRGQLIQIPVGQFVEMDEDEAENFIGAFTFPAKDEQGRPDPKFFKKLRLERPPVEETDEDLICHANGQKVANSEDLAKVLSKFSHMLAKDEDLDSKKQKEQRKENKELRAKLEKLDRLEKLVEEKLGVKLEEIADASSL